LAVEDQTERLRPLARGLRAPRAASIAGLVFSALFVSSVLLLRHQSPPGASFQELKSFYLAGDGKYVNLVGVYLAPFAGIAFIWFLAVARSQIGHRADRFFDTVFLGSGVLFVAMVFAGAAAAGALSAAIEYQNAGVPSSGAVEFARALAYSLLFTFGVRVAGVFMMVTSTIGLRTGRLSRWLVYSSWLLAAVLLFSVAFYELIILIFPAIKSAAARLDASLRCLRRRPRSRSDRGRRRLCTVASLSAGGR
jgi:hypothetical protein